MLHWTGSAWKKVPTPNPGGTTHTTSLNAVSADATNDAWSAGYYYTAGGATASVLLHWNGTTWAKVTSPN
jgi:hypothetical protein